MGLQVLNQGGIGIIRFDDPKNRNPLSESVLTRIETAVKRFEKEQLCGLIFTGSDGTFAAGADIRQVAQLDSQGAFEFGLRGQAVFSAIRAFSGLTVAAIDGFCMGGALDLAISCDRRIATRRSVLSHPGVSLGIITGWGGTQLLPRLIGRKNALRLLLTADRINGLEAHEIGLVDEIAEDPFERAIEYVEEEYGA